MNHEYYMAVAVRAAREGLEQGQTPFGACIVRDGGVVVAAHNQVWHDVDITAHAEIIALREACRKLETIDLTGCVLYSTCEPCPMCFFAANWARIGRIVYGAVIEDSQRVGFSETPLSNERLRDLGDFRVEITPGVLRDECAALFDIWKAEDRSPAY